MSTVADAWEPPQFLASPPQPPAGHLDRTEVVQQITDAVAGHRLTVVTAPAGHGKTSALAAWCRRAETPVAWFTMAEFECGPQSTYRGVVAALNGLAAARRPHLEPLAALRPDVPDVAAQYAALCAAVEQARVPLCLVVDDIHLGGEHVRMSVLGRLIEHGPPDLRIVLSCRDDSTLPLARARADGSAVVLGPEALTFTADEIIAAAHGLDRTMSREQAEVVRSATGGWAVAVRLALASVPDGRHDDGPAADLVHMPDAVLTDYIAEQVLGRLPADLEDFVLAASTCSDVDARLAAHLTGREDAHTLLEEVVRRGLFVDRYLRSDGTTIYGWHSIFAGSCQAVLRRRDPGRADLLSRRAAERKQHWKPLQATALALKGNAPDLALQIIEDNWLVLVVQEHTAALERLCLSMPSPWAADPVVRIVRACCLDILQDRDGARLLLDEVSAELEHDPAPAPGASLMVLLARLLIEDDHGALRWACDEVDARLRQQHGLSAAMQATAVFLLGWTELRLRRDPARAARLLRTAVNAAEGTGQRTLARRARANLAFAHAFNGDFLRADEALDPLVSRPGDGDSWRTYDGGIESFTAGFLAYWRNDLPSALKNFDHVVDQIGGDAAYSALALVFRALAASAVADPRLLDVAEAGLREVPSAEKHGVPWHVYATLGRVKIAAARGDIDGAVGIARKIDHPEYMPTVAAELAEIHRRAGDPLTSARLLQGLAPLGAMPSYVRVSALLTNALIQHRRGEKDSAHRLLESSLDIAWPHRIARPFSDPQPYVRRLLMEHVERGTKHQEFVASLLAAATSDRDDAPASLVALSRREREVLEYLRGTMSTAEIAAALHVSVNTIKTHQRAIYRKLGVTSRKAAVSLRGAEPVG